MPEKKSEICLLHFVLNYLSSSFQKSYMVNTMQVITFPCSLLMYFKICNVKSNEQNFIALNFEGFTVFVNVVWLLN